MKSNLFIIFLIFSCGACFYQKNSQENTNLTQPQNATEFPEKTFLPFGNPSQANKNDENNYLISGEFYTISYNRSKSLSNWVAWSIEKDDLGQIARQNNFRPDDRLPNNWKKITPFDYNGSGFSRGHMCASADRQNSIEANSSTFLMTNITPQTHPLNEGPWEKLESYSRSMARRNAKLYVIAGQYGESGKIRNKITIPTNFWKVIAVFPSGYDFEDVSEKTRIIAVDMPNSEDILEKDWREFKTTVREIEQKTGYNFFPNLPKDLQDTLETKVD